MLFQVSMIVNRRCLSSCTSQNVLKKNKNNDVIKKKKRVLEHQMNLICIEKNHFPKNPLFFRIDAVFEADNDIDNSIIGNETTITF